jgi:hypothetical protein
MTTLIKEVSDTFLSHCSIISQKHRLSNLTYLYADLLGFKVACYCYGDSTCGQRVFYQFGMTQIPIFNVNNNCSTGSTGLYIGRNVIGNGGADCVLVVGFEKMMPGSLKSFWPDRSQ